MPRESRNPGPRDDHSYGAAIFPQHAALLAASAISPEVARERGYVSADQKTRLERAGFARSQRVVPSLLIPIYGTDGELRLHQNRPDNPRLDNGKPRKYETPWRKPICLDVPRRINGQLADPAVPLWITEGARKADAAVTVGLCCIALIGVDGWQSRGVALPDWKLVRLKDREVLIAYDSDVMTKPEVGRSLRGITAWLHFMGARVRHVILPDGEDGAKVGLDDYLGAGHDVAELATLARDPAGKPPAPAGHPNKSGQPPRRPVPQVPATTITQVEATYAKWLHDGDTVTTRAVHAAYVANMVLAGDPVWIMLVGGSGTGKTERLVPLAVMPPVVLASAISGEAALLSATPRRDRAEQATGGLLRRVGDKGMLILKDFTTVLEMDRTDRGKVLAALREIYDGRWDRDVGTDGGQTLTWTGKCGFLAGCTGAIDRAHAVVNDMGPRSLFLRLPPADLDKIARVALKHMGHEQEMRNELTAATAGLLTHLDGKPHELTDGFKTGLTGLAILASQARSPVHRDWKGEIELVGDAEAPTRIIKQLGQLWRACGVLGLAHAESWEVVSRCALDSIPKLRGKVIRYLASSGPADTTAVGIGVAHPSRTVRRALQDLTAHGVVERISPGKGYADMWELTRQAKGWASTGDTLPELLGSSS